MVSPARFAGLVLPHGTTSVVADAARNTPTSTDWKASGTCWKTGDTCRSRTSIALPSCVPATPFEDPGAVLSAEELEELIDDPKVTGIGEMMNFPGVVLRRLRRTGKNPARYVPRQNRGRTRPRLAWPGSSTPISSPALRIPTSAPRLRRCARTFAGAAIFLYAKAPPPRTSERSCPALRPATRGAARSAAMTAILRISFPTATWTTICASR